MGWFGRKSRRESASEPTAGVSRPASLDQPTGFRLPADLGLSPEIEQRLRDLLWREVLLGITASDELLEAADLDEQVAHLDDHVIEAAGAAVVAARREQQRDRGTSNVEAAFAELATIGIIARAHFTCCGTCGATEIWDEIDDSRTWRGYIFFHQQDTESLLDDGTTYLNYGAFLPAWISEEEWAAIGSDEERDERYMSIVTPLMRDEVFPILEHHGIDVVWDGTHQQRILLQNADYFVAI